MDFKTSLDKMSMVTTTATTLLIIYICFTQVVQAPQTTPVVALTLGVVLPATYLYCLLMMPLAYSVTQNHIRVRRLLADWELRRDSVSAVRILEHKEMGFTLRLFGVGGLFGYFGMFRNARLGNFRMLGTRRNKALLIETITGKKFVITPDDPKEFIAYFNTFK